MGGGRHGASNLTVVRRCTEKAPPPGETGGGAYEEVNWDVTASEEGRQRADPPPCDARWGIDATRGDVGWGPASRTTVRDAACLRRPKGRSARVLAVG